MKYFGIIQNILEYFGILSGSLGLKVFSVLFSRGFEKPSQKNVKNITPKEGIAPRKGKKFQQKEIRKKIEALTVTEMIVSWGSSPVHFRITPWCSIENRVCNWNMKKITVHQKRKKTPKMYATLIFGYCHHQQLVFNAAAQL